MAGEHVDLTPILKGLGAWPDTAASSGGAVPSLSAGDGKALARLHLPPFRPSLGGTDTVVSLVRVAAIAAASSALGQASDLVAGRMPRPLELSANFFREAGSGLLTAEAETRYCGRSTVIVDVKVRDEHPGLVAALVVTQLATRDQVAAAEPARRAS